AATGAHPVEDRVRRRGDAPALQAVAELVERRDAAVEPVLDLLERATLAPGVELVEDVLLDPGSVGASAIGDPSQQVRGGRTRTCRGCVKHLDEKSDVFRSLQDDVVAAHGTHFHEITSAYTSVARPWCPMPTVSAAQLCTFLIRAGDSPSSRPR